MDSQVKFKELQFHPANIAEGAGRQSKRDFARFLSNAQGSASELETELTIAKRLGYLDESAFESLMVELDRVGRLITGLNRSLLRELQPTS